MRKPFCWIDAANWVLYDNAHVAELRGIDESNIATLTSLYSVADLEAVREQTIEECAKVADKHGTVAWQNASSAQPSMVGNLIRALKSTGEKGE